MVEISFQNGIPGVGECENGALNENYDFSSVDVIGAGCASCLPFSLPSWSSLLVEWVGGWLDGWLACWMAGRRAGWLEDWVAGWQSDWLGG